MRFHRLIGAATLALLMQISPPVWAGLVSNNNSVAALFYIGASAVPVVTSSMAPYTTPAPSEIEDYVNSMGMTTNTPPPTIPAHFVEGAIDESTMDVGDTTITITNLASPPMPFCSVSTTPCPDVFTGFGFVFFGNVDITGVTVGSGSSADFLPIAGGLTFGTTDIFVNVAGDNPATNDQLILDVTTGTVTTPIPEPASVTLLAVGLAGAWLLRPRRKHRANSGVGCS
jgi:hypothetical protein